MRSRFLIPKALCCYCWSTTTTNYALYSSVSAFTTTSHRRPFHYSTKRMSSTTEDNNIDIDIASNLQEVKSNIAKYEVEYNRPLNSVRLVAVSKTKPNELLMKAYNVRTDRKSVV